MLAKEIINTLRMEVEQRENNAPFFLFHLRHPTAETNQKNPVN
jgi:hypothetical protein